MGRGFGVTAEDGERRCAVRSAGVCGRSVARSEACGARSVVAGVMPGESVEDVLPVTAAGATSGAAADSRGWGVGVI